MSDLAYVNTRVRAMRGRLLRRSDYETLLSLPDLRNIIDQLLSSPYQNELAAALCAYPPLQALNRAFMQSLTSVAQQIVTMTGERAVMIHKLMERWDVQCLKTVMRGIHLQMPEDEIILSLEPGGKLQDDDLRPLAGMPDIASFVGLLQSWAMPWGRVLQPLLVQYRTHKSPAELEDALERHYFTVLPDAMSKEDREVMVKLLEAEAEIVNIIRCMLVVETPHRATLIDTASRQQPLVVQQLQKARRMDDAITALAGSRHRLILDEALPMLSEPGHFAILERRLDEDLLACAARLAMIDPLGIAMPAHYLQCKRNEVMNLRLITRGVYNGIPQSMIAAGLIFPAGLAA